MIATCMNDHGLNEPSRKALYFVDIHVVKHISL